MSSQLADGCDVAQDAAVALIAHGWTPPEGERGAMIDAREVIRRIERDQERDWRTEYARLLPPVPAPTRTPDCTCEWIEEHVLCAPGPILTHTRYGADCPDHQKPETLP
ncbi:hypothetical protein ACFVRV_06225 [Arthrobacter koreensis]|uniref:hypothetical protein n=1 Tax=Arthrobacter koreensis TaxID=199136 RepID=UPI0036DD35A6